MKYTISNNEQYNSLEVSFDSKPATEVIAALKSLKMRWNGKKSCWYGFAEREQIEAAINGSPVESSSTAKPIKRKTAKKPEEIKRNHNVKVGDIFYTSWGYEQTNVDFFQIIELRGASSAIVREVHLPITEETDVSSMSSDRVYGIPDEILPPATTSCFIEDNEKGKLCRINTSYYGNEPCFKVGKPGCYQETAWPYKGQKLYESWYY